MRIALAQNNYHIGNFEENSSKIISSIKKAEESQADIVVFSELSVCGYTPHDLLEQKDFIDNCTKYLELIAAQCNNVVAVVGCPTLNKSSKGKKLFNSAVVLHNGKIHSAYNKTLLPTYDIFDEYRYFEPNDKFDILSIKGKKIAVTVCEDLWEEQQFEYNFSSRKLYRKTPMEELSRFNPDFIINIAGSPFSQNQEQARKTVLSANAVKYNVPLIYVNQVGANTELIYDGGSFALNSHGEVFCQLDYFREDFRIVDLAQNNEMLNYKPISEDSVSKVYNALVLGVRDYFTKSRLSKATLGLSGGIDSAVTLAIAAEALGSENITALLLPSRFSSNHSVDDAIGLAKNLRVKYEIVNIQHSVDSIEKSMSQIFTGMKSDLTEENIQARIRGVLLMAFSNKFGHILLNTSNKSEAAVGYGTLYGDMCGGLSVLGDVYKTDVYRLARYINRNSEIIPENSIIKPPSAELRPDQKDSDSLPEYEVLDKILFSYIEQKKSESEIIAEGANPETVKKVLRLVNFNEYKRFQSPPILRVTSKAFGFGRRFPIVAKV